MDAAERKNKMNYAQIITSDVANGTGCRTSLFVSGCTHHCEGCFNKMTWDFNFGQVFTKEVEDKIIESLKPDYISGLTILGGEPMETVNQKALKPFIERVREAYPQKSIWIYSGYTWEELTDKENKRCHSEDTEDILKGIDILVDGEFVIDKRDITLRYRGSSNQRIIDVKRSLESSKVALANI